MKFAQIFFFFSFLSNYCQYQIHRPSCGTRTTCYGRCFFFPFVLTMVFGERRVRVITLALPTATCNLSGVSTVTINGYSSRSKVYLVLGGRCLLSYSHQRICAWILGHTSNSDSIQLVPKAELPLAW